MQELKDVVVSYKIRNCGQLAPALTDRFSTLASSVFDKNKNKTPGKPLDYDPILDTIQSTLVDSGGEEDQGSEDSGDDPSKISMKKLKAQVEVEEKERDDFEFVGMCKRADFYAYAQEPSLKFKILK